MERNLRATAGDPRVSVRPVQESEIHATLAVGPPFRWARGANLPFSIRPSV